MKALRFIGALMVALAISACSELNIDRAGTPIQFGATVERYNPTTRTAYSGSTNVVGEKERIDWVAGDEILIYMYYNSKNNYGNSFDSGCDKKTYVIINPISPNGYISDAKVGTYGDPLVWKEDYKESNVWNGSANVDVYWPYSFQFFGIYPALDVLNLRTDNISQSTVSFNLPATQNGDMSLAYMAATATQATYTAQGAGSVILQFYPMVTTLWFELNNDTANDIVINTIKVERVNKQDRYGSWQQDLAGAFDAKLENGVFVASDPYDNSRLSSVQANIDKPVKKSSAISLPVFIRPKKYDTNVIDISVEYTINGDRKLIKNTLGNNKTVSELVACKKYNIGISLNGGGVTVDPPTDPDLPGVVSDGPAQLITLWMIENSGIVSSALGIDQNAVNGIRNSHWNDAADALQKLFLDESGNFDWNKWETFMNLLQNVQSVSSSAMIINGPITGEDFKKFFPNLESLNVKTENSIEIDGLEHLESVYLYDHPVDITIRNCTKLTKLEFDNPKNNVESTYTFENLGLVDFNCGWDLPLATFNFIKMHSLKTVHIFNASVIEITECENLTASNVTTDKETTINWN